MALKKEVFESVINTNFKNVKFILTDMVGDEDHYSLEISSPEFEGLSHLQSHRLINSRLKDYTGSKVHALTILSINVI